MSVNTKNLPNVQEEMREGGSEDATAIRAVLWEAGRPELYYLIRATVETPHSANSWDQPPPWDL